MWGAPHDWNERCAICASGSTHSHGWWTNSHLLYRNVHQPECIDQPVGVHLAVTVAIIILLTLAVGVILTVAVEFSIAISLGVAIQLRITVDGTTDCPDSSTSCAFGVSHHPARSLLEFIHMRRD